MAQVSRWLRAVTFGVSVSSAPWLLAQEAEPPAKLPVESEPSPLLTEPTTPVELFEATQLLIELGRFDLAKTYLEQFDKADPSAEDLIKLRDRLGTASFLRLAKIPALQPVGGIVLKKLNAAALGQANDPAFVDALIGRLAGQGADREVATLELRNLGAQAVPRMLQTLEAGLPPAHRDAIVLAFARIGEPAVPVLVAALDNPNESSRIAAIEALQQIGDRQAAIALWPLAFATDAPPGTRGLALQALAKLRTGNPDRTDRLSTVIGVEELRSSATDLFTGRTELPPDEEGEATRTTWFFNEQTRLVEARQTSLASAALHLAQRQADAAFRLSPERTDLQRLMLATRLASDLQKQGWDRPLPVTADSTLGTAIVAGRPLLAETLRDAMHWGRTDAAWGALSGLKEIPSRDLLRGSPGRPSPLIAALNYPDPRVQFDAAITILRAEPNAEFSGSVRVVEILRRALTDPGQARAVVIDADKDRGTTVGGYLAEQGFDPLTERTGKRGFLAASSLTGVDLVVVHVNAVEWGVTQTLANLRADARTAYVPILISGPEETRDKLTRLVHRTPATRFVAEAASARDFWEQASPLVAQLAVPPMTAEQRAEHRELAVYWLATIATSKNARLYDITEAETELLALIDDEPLVQNLVVALGMIPTVTVQARLAEFAMNHRLPETTRVAAAVQLAAHISRFGLLLTKDDVQAVTIAQEASIGTPIGNALGLVVSAFDPNAGLAAQRLQKLTPRAP